MRHPSKYTDKKVTSAQKLAEIMCDRRAKGLNQELPWQFWKQKNWLQYFMYQVKHATPLLAKHSFDKIDSLLKEDPWTILSSLRSKKFENALEKYNYVKVEVKPTKEIDKKENKKFTKINKLENLLDE